jgi:hypothetical protein
LFFLEFDYLQFSRWLRRACIGGSRSRKIARRHGRGSTRSWCCIVCCNLFYLLILASEVFQLLDLFILEFAETHLHSYNLRFSLVLGVSIENLSCSLNVPARNLYRLIYFEDFSFTHQKQYE